MGASTDFRLERVEILQEDGSLVDVVLADTATTDSWTTLITGRNGVGKSRLLSAIAAAFETLDGHRPRHRDSVAMSYWMAGHECAFRAEKGKIHAYLDGHPVQPELLPRPSAVVAATASAFDKFNLPKESRLFERRTHPTRAGLYKYLGLRDARGRVSSRAGVFRALEQLFDANSDDRPRRLRVADVFDYLGYVPKVEVIYTWTIRGFELLHKDGRVTTGDVSRFLTEQKRRMSEGTRISIPNYVFEDDQVAEDLMTAIAALRQLSDRRNITLLADFSSPSPGEEDQLRMARQLTRAGLVQMSEVALRRSVSNLRIEITDASSGELSLVVTLLGIASSIEDGSLIMIDEPEISLHPQWQAEYLKRLRDVFADFRGCHFIVATHSPTLVSGATPERTSIIGLGDGPVDHRPGVAGSVDEVLLTTFGVVSKSNLYLRDLLVTALRAAEDGDLDSNAYNDTMADLKRARADLNRADDVVQVIDQLVRVRTRLSEKDKQ